MYLADEHKIWVCKGEDKICMLPKMANRHGMIAGATGTGKTVTLKVLAEGVETEGQLALLRSERCDGVQGYLIGRPLPIEAWRDIIAGTAAATAAARRA